MTRILVTGATGFLGYHVVRHLNSRGIRPRVLELRDSRPEVLDRLDVERCSGHVDEPAAVLGACSDVDVLLHLAFKVAVGGSSELLADMRRINVSGTRQLLRAAASMGVRRAVVTGSALAVGVNRHPAPLTERANWQDHELDLPYAMMRREAELNALVQATPSFDVVSVCPSFTFGPDDPVGAPANKLLQTLASGKLRFTLPIGFGCLDVRDFAQGMMLAAERGRSGERYLLSGENVTTNGLLRQAASIAGVRAPWFAPPKLLLHAAVGALEIVSRIRGKSAPITRNLLQIVGRYAWYDTSKARKELGWSPRPLAETLSDTIEWLRESGSGAPVSATPMADAGA